MAKSKKSDAAKRSALCFHPGCRRPLSKDSGVRVCRDHAGERVAVLQAELKGLRETYGDAAKPDKAA